MIRSNGKSKTTAFPKLASGGRCNDEAKVALSDTILCARESGKKLPLKTITKLLFLRAVIQSV